MPIQMESGGESKTYRYYPYDALYVDANGKINTEGKGQRVKEAYFNGIQYYPDLNCGLWGAKIVHIFSPNISYRSLWRQNIGIFRISYAFFATFDSSKYYVYAMHIPAGSTLETYERTSKSPYPIAEVSSMRFIAQVKADFDESAKRNDNIGTVAFNKNYFTSKSRMLFDALESGMTIISSETDVICHANAIQLQDDVSLGFSYGVSGYYSLSGVSHLPYIQFRFDYDPNAVPPQQGYWETDGSGGQYPIFISLGYKNDPTPVTCGNSYVRTSIAKTINEVPQSAWFEPSDMEFDASVLFPLA